MSGFVVFKKLTVREALQAMEQAEVFLRLHPSRKVVRTDLFTIRRGYVVADVLAHMEDVAP